MDDGNGRRCGKHDRLTGKLSIHTYMYILFMLAFFVRKLYGSDDNECDNDVG